MEKSYRLAFEYMKKYNRKSIFYAYLKKLFLLIALPVLLLLITIHIYHQGAINSEIQISEGTAFEKLVVSMDNTIEECLNSALVLGQDPRVSLFMNASEEQHLKDYMNYSKYVFEQLGRSIETLDSIDAVHIYSFENRYVMSSSGTGGLVENFPWKEWYTYYEKSGEINFIINSEKDSCIYICFAAYDTQGVCGLVAYEIKYTSMEKLFHNSAYLADSEFYLTGTDGKIIYSSDGKSGFSEEANKAFATMEKDNLKSCKKNNIVYFRRSLNSYPAVSLTYVSDLKYADRNLGYLNLLFVICLIVAVLMPIFISLYISADFYRSVVKIVSELNADDIDNSAEIDEFTFISEHIIEMIKRNEDMEKELVQRTSNFKKAQAVALQTQINPHFMFNTLNLISLSARNLAKGKNVVSTTVSLLAELLSYVLDTHNYIVDIEEEIHYAKKYIEIQSIKHNNGFECVWDIDANVLKCKTIKMILQPLLENSFQHGLTYLEGKKGVIHISAKSNNGKISFCVRDNGIKIPTEKLLEVQERLQTEDLPQKGHIGLVNINQRIKLVYGDDYGVRIESDDSGTATYIEFPQE